MQKLYKIAFIDSGHGLESISICLKRLCDKLGLKYSFLYLQDTVSWGKLFKRPLKKRLLYMASEAFASGADAIVLACNTASVNFVNKIRSIYEEKGVKVIATVPAIKPACAKHESIAVWVTHKTAKSKYLRNLIYEFGANKNISIVTCGDLAAAIEKKDNNAINKALKEAVLKTPPSQAIVLGCTHYPLIIDKISSFFPNAKIYDSSKAIALQVLKRLGEA